MHKIFFNILFLFYIGSIFAISDDNKKILDNFVNSKKYNDLDKFLKENSKNENYKEIEDYLIKIVKELIQNDKIDDAKKIIRIMLDNNLDNLEAQDIFVSLEKIKKEEKTLKVTKITFDNFLFSFDLGIIDFMMFQSHFYNEYYGNPKWNTKYGMSTDFSFCFQHPYIAAGIEGLFDTYFVSLYPEKTSTEFSYSISGIFSVPLIKIPLYLALGFRHLIYNQFEKNVPLDVYISNLKSLIIGLRLYRWFFYKYIGIESSFNYYFVSPFTSYIDAVFDLSIGVLYRPLKIKRTGLIVKTEIAALFLIYNAKLENYIKIQTCIGVGINEK
ncbi:MAG: hypothetical protein JXB50_06410 [Spirochaetes bacterium]|nr:hypothetical protein [Spirochaetota bacterium]